MCLFFLSCGVLCSVVGVVRMPRDSPHGLSVPKLLPDSNNNKKCVSCARHDSEYLGELDTYYNTGNHYHICK